MRACRGPSPSRSPPLSSSAKLCGRAAMDFHDILYARDGAVATITLNRPTYRNAQSYRMLDEIDEAFALARADHEAQVVIVRGSGGVFSTGHDLGTEEGLAYRKGQDAQPGIQIYDQFKHYN